MKGPDISEAKTRQFALSEDPVNGNDLLLVKGGNPLCSDGTLDDGPSKPRIAGRMKGKIVVGPDFDSLPDDLEFHG